MKIIERAIVRRIEECLTRIPKLIQVLIGPRQSGKTTAARKVLDRWRGPKRYAVADLPLPPGPEWIQSEWQLARNAARKGHTLLVLDEVQKIAGWSETVKALWDEDRALRIQVRVLLLGSSALLLGKGTSESLAGRFFLHRCLHWSFRECREAFGWDLDRWLFFGGYPGAAALAGDEQTWRSYVLDSLIETVLARDVLSMERVTKPALLRHLFALAAGFPAQVLSYNKMLGQLQDAGNTTTLAHYLRLLDTAFLVRGLERFSPGGARSRGSSPKLVLWNNALVTATGLASFETVRADHAAWGRIVENAVGAHLLNHLQGLAYEICYWRDRRDEVDFVVRAGRSTWGLEVKSGLPRKPAGLGIFCRRFEGIRPLVIGSGGMPLEEFFRADPAELFS